MSLRDEILQRELKKEQFKANKDKVFEQMAGEIFRILEARMKNKRIHKICVKNLWKIKDTGERGIVLPCSLCFSITSYWGEKNVEVRNYYDSDVIGLDVETTHDIDVVLKYLEGYFKKDDLLIYDYRIKVENDNLFLDSAYMLNNLKYIKDVQLNNVYRTNFNLLLKL